MLLFKSSTSLVQMMPEPTSCIIEYSVWESLKEVRLALLGALDAREPGWSSDQEPLINNNHKYKANANNYNRKLNIGSYWVAHTTSASTK